MPEILISGANVLDAENGTLQENLDVRVIGPTIQEVGRGLRAGDDAIRIRTGGRTLMPGLIDAHVHVMAAVSDHAQLAAMPPYLVAAHAQQELAAMLRRGFTTIRDAGGAEGGLARAVDEGLFAGPRIFPSGLALSQTAGMGDFRLRPEYSQGCPTCRSRRTISRVVDGADGVARACREELADGATQIKIMASGGLSGSTPIRTTHFTTSEIGAAVEEAARAGTYVMAHAYESAAIRRAVDAGVRTIEHGNLLDRETAAYIAPHAYLVPTLTTYEASIDYQIESGADPESLEPTRRTLAAGVRGLRMCRDEGVRLGFGTDLEGAVRVRQLREFAIRREQESPAEILHSALVVNAEILGRRDTLGCIVPQAAADILVVDGNPLEDLSLFVVDGPAIRVIIAQGRIHKLDLPTS
jgi:imidazolonepropionase-like amidohydrolase